MAVERVWLCGWAVSHDCVLASPDPHIHTSAGHCYFDALALQLNKEEGGQQTFMYVKHTQSSFKIIARLLALEFLGARCRVALLSNRSYQRTSNNVSEQYQTARHVPYFLMQDGAFCAGTLASSEPNYCARGRHKDRPARPHCAGTGSECPMGAGCDILTRTFSLVCTRALTASLPVPTGRWQDVVQLLRRSSALARQSACPVGVALGRNCCGQRVQARSLCVDESHRTDLSRHHSI